MSNEKFTPGEWRVSRYKDDPNFDLYDYLIVETVADEPLGIAAMYQRNDIESEANAALISAAPKMYNRLKEVKSDFRALLFNPYISEHTKECIKIMIDHIEDDLKKARGEE